MTLKKIITSTSNLPKNRIFVSCEKHFLFIFWGRWETTPPIKLNGRFITTSGGTKSNNYSQNLSTFHPIETLLGFDLRRKQHIYIYISYLHVEKD